MNKISFKKSSAIASLAIFTVIAAQTSMATMTSEEAVEAALWTVEGDFEEINQVQVDGRDVWQVTIADSDGSLVVVYFDAETGTYIEPGEVKKSAAGLKN